MNRHRTRDPRLDTAWLAGALRDQADEHEADRTRVEAGFDRLISAESGRAERRRFKGRRFQRPLRLRLIGVPLGVLAAVATTSIAVGVTLHIGDRPSRPANQAVASPSPTQTAEERRSAPPATLRPASSASARSEASPTAAPGPVTATGALDSHSNQYWTQEDLTVTTTRAVTALRVTVVVAGGAGGTTVQSTGSWSTILSQYIDGSAGPTASGLTYEFTLKPGQVLQPGSYVFGFQFDRPATARASALDTYSITATTVDGAKPASASGRFPG